MPPSPICSISLYLPARTAPTLVLSAGEVGRGFGRAGASGRRFEEIADLVPGGEHLLDLAPQVGQAGTGPVEVRGPLGGRQGERRRSKRLRRGTSRSWRHSAGQLVTLSCDKTGRGLSPGGKYSSPRRSAKSHRRANSHQRAAVAGETPRAAAASATERPAKNRSSTSLAFGRFDGREPRQRVVQIDESLRRFGDAQGRVQVHAPPAAAVADGRLAPGGFHQDSSHRLGGGGEKVPATVELLVSDQPQIGFMDQGGGVERVAGGLGCHLRGGQACAARRRREGAVPRRPCGRPFGRLR